MKKQITTLLIVLQMSFMYAQTNVTSYDANDNGRLGNYSTYFGVNAGTNSTTNGNVFNGYYAGYNNTGHYNIINGYYAGYNNTGINNIFNGNRAGYSNNGNYNVFTGYLSGYKNTTGSYNVFSGYQSGYNNTTGQFNVFIGGYRTGYANTTGSFNVYTGRQSGASNTTGSYNVSYGVYSGFGNLTGSDNTYIGHSAGFNSTGSYNTFLGRSTGSDNTGDNNVYLGYRAGQISTGSNNVFLGSNAGYNEQGSNKLCIANTDTSTPLIYGDFATKQMSINTNNLPSDTNYVLAVGGKMVAEEVKVALMTGSAWPDYVFTKTYKLPTLQEVENHINEKGHLKNIPSAKDVKENGVLLGNMNAKLLEKIEELTLYIIQQNKEIQQLKKEQKEHAALKADVARLEQLILSIKAND